MLQVNLTAKDDQKEPKKIEEIKEGFFTPDMEEELKKAGDEAIEEAIETQKLIEEEYKKAGKEPPDMSSYFANGIDKELDKLDINEAQKNYLRVAIFYYLQEQIDVHLQNTFPDEFFETAQRLINEGKLEQDELVGLIIFIYEGTQKESILKFINETLMEAVPKFIELFKQNQKTYEKVLQMPPEKQKEFIEASKAGEFEKADSLLQ
jgi:hypothetical protein